MMDGDMVRFMREEIKRQVNIVIAGLSGDNDQFTETINSQYPGSPPVTDRPVMHPYGFSSRAPNNTVQVVARVGDHPGNRMVLGHRDAGRPVLDQGESVQYSVGGYQVFLKNGEIILGKDGVLEVMVVGDTLKAFLISLVQLIVKHQHMGNLGYPTSFPNNASDFTTLQAQNLDNSKILAKDGGRF